MKKIYLLVFLFFILLFSSISFAGLPGHACGTGRQAVGAYLQLSLFDDSDFTVALDDIEYSEPGNVADFENVQPGEHSLRVTRSSPSVPMKADVIFQGKIKIPAEFNVYAVIDEYNGFSIYKKVPVEKGINKCDCAYYRRCGSKGNYEHHEEIKNDECSYKIMKEADFKSFKKAIGSRNFESTNMDITKEMLDKNVVSTDQVKEILSFFTFENSKLEVAKYAYSHTCDKKNYFKMYDSFTFDSSVEELKNYISGK
jgi:hypothetical protein